MEYGDRYTVQAIVHLGKISRKTKSSILASYNPMTEGKRVFKIEDEWWQDHDAVHY